MPLGAFKAALMGTAGVSTGDVVLLSSQTASSSASITFSSGITSTYGEYIFKFYNMHPSDTSGPELSFQCNATDSTSYDETITSTAFYVYHEEDDGAAAMAYTAGWDQAQGTALQTVIINIGADNDESGVGELHLFNPASTTYVKHWYALGSSVTHNVDDPNSTQIYTAGYMNTTTAIDDIQFKMSAGNIDTGTIKMWGVK